ncbi:PspA/IM30 family protein [Dyella mobilis]|uniref:PspA/IM30 family protein n=1 Tax=Dyella mobilis TaxID=1849582 RepID=A0ABS2KH93_9GAMM|nr:PspA/IM30 family protein [Dyella mobilis]MBM7130537.1 PspA/IM30 family protein [Dyella mobilis]GLQ97164.1 hypothetical protein GCM10007863_15840 [Dyella mobilis]
MPDSLQDRVARLISGTAHAFVDRMENLAPEATMAQAIREIEQVASEVRGELGTIEAAKYQLVLRLGKLTSEHEELRGKAELAIKEQRDDLAIACLERQTLIEDQLPVLQQSLASQRERAQECERYVRALLARKHERESMLNGYLAIRRSIPRNVGDSESNPYTSERQRHEKVEEAESAFDRALAQEPGSKSISGTTSDTMKLREISELHRKKRIDERLTELKYEQSNGKAT